MIIDVKVPAVGESISEVTIASWLKKDGESVKIDEAICSIESDKATLEISAPKSGKLKILIQEGETVKIGVKVAEVDTEAAGTVSTPAPAVKTSGADVKSAPLKIAPIINDSGIASPAASKILAEKGIEKNNVVGSGRDGRITKDDAVRAQSVGNAALADANPISLLVKETFNDSFNREAKREKMTNLRKTIAKRLVEAKNTTAMLTTFNEIDMSVVMDLRKKYKDSFKEKHGVSLGFMSFFTKAACQAIKKYPAVNAQISGDEIVYHNYADIGVAVSTPKGLVVPVLRNAESMSLAQIELKIIELATKARDGKLGMDEMQGGTFTITNGGVFGSMLSTPIINLPQSAILGMHNIVERPVAINGQVFVRPIMYVALSYDHRIVDGRESVSFLKTIKEMLEEPSRLLLDV